jgi:hypothetical protein
MIEQMKNFSLFHPRVDVRQFDRMRFLKVQVPGPFELALKNGKAYIQAYLDGHNYKQKKLTWKQPLFLMDKMEGWEVSTCLPEGIELADIPRPVDHCLNFEEALPSQIAALNFLGKVSYSTYIRHMDFLKEWSQQHQFQVIAPSRLVIHDWHRPFCVVPKNEIILHLDLMEKKHEIET